MSRFWKRLRPSSSTGSKAFMRSTSGVTSSRGEPAGEHMRHMGHAVRRGSAPCTWPMHSRITSAQLTCVGQGWLVCAGVGGMDGDGEQGACAWVFKQQHAHTPGMHRCVCVMQVICASNHASSSADSGCQAIMYPLPCGRSKVWDRMPVAVVGGASQWTPSGLPVASYTAILLLAIICCISACYSAAQRAGRRRRAAHPPAASDPGSPRRRRRRRPARRAAHEASPFSLMLPLPALQCATATAVFYVGTSAAGVTSATGLDTRHA
eukprot:364429-Chlamydomonas_euryale.AAC.31